MIKQAERLPDDTYMTPPAAIAAALDRIPLRVEGTILEPCAGTGNVVRALRERYPGRGIRAIDINSTFAPSLHQWASVVAVADFREWAVTYRREMGPKIGPGLIITNPPFSIAREILDAAFLVATPQTQIVMLLRLSFLESRARRAWWQDHPVDGLYPLSERPSFTGDGKTLGQAFGWFVWRGIEKGVYVL